METGTATNAENEPLPRGKGWQFLKWSGWVIVALVIGVLGYFKYQFPYGHTHCCIAQISLALRTYAEDNGGKLPSGQPTPEASLSLLAKTDLEPIYALRGKTVSLSAAEAAFKKDGILGPDTCDWHYVDGLNEDDDPQIAVLWDKVGLGHNGQRLKDGGHEVGYLDGSHNYVSAVVWPVFLEKQKQLLGKRTGTEFNSARFVRVITPDGSELQKYEGSYRLEDTSSGMPNFRSGTRLNLRWRDFRGPDGLTTYVLILPELKLRSKPLNIEVRDGRLATNDIIFRMERL